MTDFFDVTTYGAEELKALFKTIPPKAKPTALNAFTKYAIEEGGQNSLRYYPPYQSPTYVRTYNLKNDWKATPASGTRAYITNTMPYAPYPMGNPPASHMRKIGWRGAIERIMSNMSGAIAAAQKAVMGLFR